MATARTMRMRPATSRPDPGSALVSAATPSSSDCAVSSQIAWLRRRARITPNPSATNAAIVAELMRGPEEPAGEADQGQQAAAGEQRRGAQDPHLRLRGLGQGEAEAERADPDREEGQLRPEAAPVGQEQLGGENEDDPVTGGSGPLQQRQVAARVLEQ